MISLALILSKLKNVDELRYIGTIGELTRLVTKGEGLQALPACYVGITDERSTVKQGTARVAKDTTYTVSIYTAMLDVRDAMRGEASIDNFSQLRKRIIDVVEGYDEQMGLIVQLRGELQTGMPEGVLVHQDNFEITERGRVIHGS